MLNNPINASDPSGHKCVGEPEECLDDDGTTSGGFPGGGSTGGSTGGGGGGGDDDDNDDDDGGDSCNNDPNCELDDGGGHNAKPTSGESYCFEGDNGGWQCGSFLNPTEVSTLIGDLRDAHSTLLIVNAGIWAIVGFLGGTLASKSPQVGIAVAAVAAIIGTAIAISADNEYENVIDELTLASDVRPCKECSIFITIEQSGSGAPIQLQAYGYDPVIISESTLDLISTSSGIRTPLQRP